MLKSLGALALAAACLLAAPAAAQQRTVAADSVAALDLPDAVAAAVVDFFNDPRRRRFVDSTRLAAGGVLRADVAVLEGPLEVAGRVEGSVVAVNADVRLFPGAEVTGDLLVVGGGVTGLDSARVGGEILVYSRRLDYRREGDRIVRERARVSGGVEGEGGEGWERSDFLISTGRSYNRVEGLPIIFGPRIETEGSNPLRVHALGIYRTAAGFTLDTDQMGYYVRAEHFLGGRRELRAGVTASSLVEPIEDWHLSDLENGLSTFLFHRDFRDHYEREGLGAHLAWEPRGGPLELAVEGHWERHRTLAPRSPWTLFDNDVAWRPQPLIAEGEIGSVALRGSWDTRSDRTDPSTGWLVRARLEQALHADLALPDSYYDDLAGSDALPFGPPEYGRFTTGLVDVRRYNRVDPDSRLNFRFLAGGSLDGSPLPPQRQHALGGEGSLPGYSLFRMDCGARRTAVYRPRPDPVDPGEAFYPAYGCDAFALLQADYRGRLDFSLQLDSAPWDEDNDSDGGWGIGWDLTPDWTVFVDAARAWSLQADRPDEDLLVDVGVGILVDRLGVFVARPLVGGGGVNLFVRLGPRF